MTRHIPRNGTRFESNFHRLFRNQSNHPVPEGCRKRSNRRESERFDFVAIAYERWKRIQIGWRGFVAQQAASKIPREVCRWEKNRRTINWPRRGRRRIAKTDQPVSRAPGLFMHLRDPGFSKVPRASEHQVPAESRCIPVDNSRPPSRPLSFSDIDNYLQGL